MKKGATARLFDIKRDCADDGPGIRTTVFFKGCPLACSWCHNPAGLTGRLSFSHHPERCRPDQCGTVCATVCPPGGLVATAAGLQMDRPRCDRCDRCFAACPRQALAPVGFDMALDELLYRVTIDRPFYEATGGGVTVSGGEPTRQMAVLGQFLAQLRRLGVHTALETCGYFPYVPFARQVLPYLDLIYFDLKLVDEGEHRRHTGRSNRLILANLARLAQQTAVTLRVRLPLIPGITATPDNLRQAGAFLRALAITEVNLLPYNPVGRDHYPNLGLVYTHPAHWLTEEELQECMGWFFQ